MNDEEAIQLLKKITNAEGSEEEINFWVAELTKFYPSISDIIFWSFEEMTVEEILRKAKDSNRPIIL